MFGLRTFGERMFKERMFGVRTFGMDVDIVQELVSGNFFEEKILSKMNLMYGI